MHARAAAGNHSTAKAIKREAWQINDANAR